MRKHFVLVALAFVLLTACGADEPAPPTNSLSNTAPTTAPTSTPTSIPSPIAATATTTATVAATATPTPPVSPLQSILPTPEPVSEIPVYGYQVIEEYPHDPRAYTQGLVYVDGTLYEGTGRRGQSTLRRVDLETGEVLQGVRLPDDYFGEGITLFEDRLYQLTWTSGTGFVFDRESFDLVSTFTYPTEGWGVTHDGEQLIMSDGTTQLYFLDPDTLTTTRQVTVMADGTPIDQLNELEYIDGVIYANIWQTDRIAQIDPVNGEVIAWIDLTGLFPPEKRSEAQAVLNGIAYDAETERLFVTGKLWPSLYWIELVAPADAE